MPEPRMEKEPERVSVDEIKRRMDRGEEPVFLDCRNEEAWQRSAVKLPGALRVPADRVDHHLDEIPRGRPVFTYCTWPQEHSSARAARELSQRGFTDVRPVLGGFDAWRDAGYPTEPKS